MKKSIKPQIESLSKISSSLVEIVASLEDAKRAKIMPDFFDYLAPGNVSTLEQQNNRLKNIIGSYEGALMKIDKSIEGIIVTLEGLKE